MQAEGIMRAPRRQTFKRHTTQSGLNFKPSQALSNIF
jgi:hypothetical protein